MTAHGRWPGNHSISKYGLLNEGLLFDWLAVYAFWEKMKSQALACDETGGPRKHENFEAMAKEQVEWAKREH